MLYLPGCILLTTETLLETAYLKLKRSECALIIGNNQCSIIIELHNIGSYKLHNSAKSFMVIVFSSTMKCFNWRTRTCRSSEEEYELCNRINEATEPIVPLNDDNEVRLYSPRFEEARNREELKWGKRYICIYNVSLSCPRNTVSIEKINHLTNWPHDTEGCQNYVAFYNDRNSNTFEHRYCGSEPSFKNRKLSSSFLAIMWNSHPQFNNIGTFEFQATCSQPDPTQPPAIGSGDANLINL